MTNSWVAVLGAGKDQLEILRAVRRAGYRSVAFDSDAQAAGFHESDHSHQVSNRDADDILEHLKGYEVAGVIAAGSEVPEVVATVQHRLGLPGMPVAAAFALRDKRLYKRALRAAGVPCTRGAHRSDGVVVVKPNDGAGSRGVKIAPWDEFYYIINSAHLTEAYQPGPQISSETIVWDGRGVTVAFADRWYDHANMTHPKELGVSMPSRWESEREMAHDVAMRAARVLGITRGTIKCDLVLTKQGPLIIECTSRLSGGPLANLVFDCHEVDYFAEAVRVACGLEPRWEELDCSSSDRAALDMESNEMDYDDVAKWIPKELPECV